MRSPKKIAESEGSPCFECTYLLNVKLGADYYWFCIDGSLSAVCVVYVVVTTAWRCQNSYPQRVAPSWHQGL